MKLKILRTTLYIAIFACIFSIVSTTNNTNTIHADRILGNALALPKSEQRRTTGVPKTTSRSVTLPYQIHRTIIVTHDESDSVMIEYPIEYFPHIPEHYLTNLRAADRLAENVLAIFGYLLDRRNSRLSLEQYASIRMIHNTIRCREFKMYRVHHSLLSSLRNRSCGRQFFIVLRELSTQPVTNVACPARFLQDELASNNLNLHVLEKVLHGFNFLTGLNDPYIFRGYLNSAHMQRGSDYYSRVTEATLGPIFVHIFSVLKNLTLPVTQSLFSTILLNLPNYDHDPVFNEYIRFVADMAWRRNISNWNTKDYILHETDDPTHVIDRIVAFICRGPNQDKRVNRALRYIAKHFRDFTNDIFRPTITNYARPSPTIISIDELFSVITPAEYNSKVIKLKVELIKEMIYYRTNVQKNLVGINHLGYATPKAMLVAILIRLRIRLPERYVNFRRRLSDMLEILVPKMKV